MKLLITGVAGFVGSTLVRKLLSDGEDYQITGIDNFSYGYRERLADIKDQFNFIECDVSEMECHVKNEAFDAIIHCAAIAPLPECQIDSHRALVQNVANCGSVADFALKTGTKNIVFFSSGAIYEGVTTFPTPETIVPEPRLVYPTTKYIAEQYFKAMCQSHELNVVAIRLFNLYGPHQDYFRKQPPLIGYLLRSLLKQETAVLFSNGTQARDYIYIDDLVRFVLRSIEYMRGGAGHGFTAVNAGSGSAVSVNEVIEIIESLSGRAIDIKRMPPGAYWDKYPELFDREIGLKKNIVEAEVGKYTLADVAKSEEVLDWRAEIDMRTGLSECLNFAKTIM